MRLLLDEQISRKVAEQLRGRGHDVVAVTEDPDLRGAPDADVFEQAQRQERIVVTYNRDDFLELSRQFAGEGREHTGLVIVNPTRHPNSDVGRLVSSLERLIDGFSAQPSFIAWLK